MRKIAAIFVGVTLSGCSQQTTSRDETSLPDVGGGQNVFDEVARSLKEEQEEAARNNARDRRIRDILNNPAGSEAPSYTGVQAEAMNAFIEQGEREELERRIEALERDKMVRDLE